jgi:hypothetical protein
MKLYIISNTRSLFTFNESICYNVINKYKPTSNNDIEKYINLLNIYRK